jgi:hypothetical protein
MLVAVLLGGGAVGLLSAPRLVDAAPLLLIALRPTPSILLLAGARPPFAAALLVAAVPRALLDIGYFGVARANLRSVVALRPAGRRLVAALSRRTTERALLWLCLFNTNAVVDGALGTADVRWQRFLRFLVPGTLLSTTAYLLAARAVSSRTRDLVGWLDGHATQAIGLLAAIGLARVAAATVRRRRRRPPGTTPASCRARTCQRLSRYQGVRSPGRSG